MKSLYSLLSFFLLCCFLTCAQAQAQSGSITGLLLQSEGQPVPFAFVMMEGSNRTTTANDLGRFTFNKLAPGTYTLRISAPGLLTQTEIVMVKDNTPTDLVITLEPEPYEMPQVNILAKNSRIFHDLPGSASYINTKELSFLAPLSGNEALRRVPGLHVVEEEGAGLRVNVGIRGLDPDRGRNVLILEDGVPVSLNPYGESEMYYTPSIDRMAGVEVLKGSGQVLYGPQTIGGVINYITADPPQEARTRIRLQGGQGGYASGLVSYGNTFGNTGIQVNLLRRQAQNLGPTEFALTDFSSKLKLVLSEKSVLGVKIGVYDELSNSTYVGLTQPMYDAGGQDFVRIAPLDELEVRRYSLSATHEYHFSSRLVLKTNAFGYTTTRNWRRQGFAASRPNDWTGVVWGDTTVAGGALYMRNNTGNRNRQFEVAGLEPRLHWDYTMGQLPGTLISGVRYLYERANEQRVNGTRADARSGNLVEDEIRTGRAFSAFVQNKLDLSPGFVLTAGVRVEQYDYERDILRRSYSSQVRDTNLVASNNLVSVIPGLGLNYRAGSRFTFFGGVHRGFAPPRIKDAISNVGEAYQLDAELSWNYEIGTRASLTKGVFVELTGFLMDFSNQIIPISVSSGGTGVGEVNGGRTMHRGVEGAFVFAIGEWLQAGYRLDFDLNVTLQESFFNGDRFVVSGSESVNIAGNRTPYAPNLLLSSALSLELSQGLQVRITSTYVGDQMTDEENSIEPAANGRSGLMEDYFLLDATVQYTFPQLRTTFLLSGKNLTDQRYISSRRPEGIRVGLPRFLTAGFSVQL